MEIFQNGRFSTGEPVYQIGTKNADGTYEVKVFDLMTKAQAEAKMKSMGVKVETPKPAAPTKKSKLKYDNMSKLELEALMRKEGIELDRRESKAKLLSEVKAHFKGK
tara:strand:- start:2430 stop:2750 length:321 start_codon:yes stop_codon:yes gene_type:complete